MGLLVRLTLLLLVFGAPPVAAQSSGETCFPETEQCISGRFRQYWEQNGGVPVFGFPITPARMERNRDTGDDYLTQWFERNRFELHTDNRPPHDVLLGRLGDDRLLQLGRRWQSEPKAAGPRAGCLWFEVTRHNVCDQAPGLGFRTYWLSHGLTDPALDAFNRSLMLFGLPLTEPRMETNADGDTVLTQWFERARFEWHPQQEDEFKVLLGRLGVEVRDGGPLMNPERAVGFAVQSGRGFIVRTAPLAIPARAGTPQEVLASADDVVAGVIDVGRHLPVGGITLPPGTYRVAVRKHQMLFTNAVTGAEFDPGLAAELRVMPRSVTLPETIMTDGEVCFSWSRVQVCSAPSPAGAMQADERDRVRDENIATVNVLVGSGLMQASDITIDKGLPDVKGTAAVESQQAGIIAAPTVAPPPAAGDQRLSPGQRVLLGVMSVLLPLDTPSHVVPPGRYAVFVANVGTATTGAGARYRALLVAADGRIVEIPVDFRHVLGQPFDTQRMTPIAQTPESRIILQGLCFLFWCIPGTD